MLKVTWMARRVSAWLRSFHKVSFEQISELMKSGTSEKDRCTPLPYIAGIISMKALQLGVALFFALYINISDWWGGGFSA